MLRKLKELLNDDIKLTNKYKKQVEEVLKLEDKMKDLTDEELQNYTNIFRERLRNGETIDEILVEAVAVVREAARRTRNEFPFPVQILGSLIINGGDIAEMKTGEGKTLTSTMAIYLNALMGYGVHVVTVNEYLSERDATEMGKVFKFLGLTVGVNKANMTKSEKKAAYACDVTYTTNSELGFDYLRDNMVFTAEDKVQRGLHFALIDEADSILIDESRTPLIISSSQQTDIRQYTDPDKIVKTLKYKEDYDIDIQDKQVYLLQNGIEKVEKAFNIENMYDIEYSILVHRINQALKANYIMKKDTDYLINDKGEIMIIDQFTGRVMEGRSFSEGLHQAIEAKEGVNIRPESKTVATITYQNFFRLYDKLSGMTGTAKTEEEEFLSIYNMRVIPVETNRPVIRVDYPDSIYASKKVKYKALVKEVKEIHKTGQPILVGTASVETNELISKLMDAAEIPHEVLNAKNHAREAEIIAKAGQVGAVTIATNMAGRGTDIKLSDEARKLGGLAVLGTERHESRRIDNQLRGRSGRQGDPGFSRFYVSMEDDLMKRFASEMIKEQMKTFGDEKLESKMVTKAITSAQKRVEGQNFDIRKRLIDYDDVLRKQREIIYDQRDYIMQHEDIRPHMEILIRNSFNRLVESCYEGNTIKEEELKQLLSQNSLEDIPLIDKSLMNMEKEAIQDELFKEAWEKYNFKTEMIKPSVYQIEKSLLLQIIDDKWQKHIDTMTNLRNGIHLRSYAQNNPLQQYIDEGYDLFDTMIREIEDIYAILICNAEVSIEHTSPENKETVEEKTDEILETKEG